MLIALEQHQSYLQNRFKIATEEVVEAFGALRMHIKNVLSYRVEAQTNGQSSLQMKLFQAHHGTQEQEICTANRGTIVRIRLGIQYHVLEANFVGGVVLNLYDVPLELYVLL